MFRRTSKGPEILGRLDVRLNVLEFQDVYTYFLGRLDVNPQKFVIYTGSAQDDDDDDNDDDDHENHDNPGDRLCIFCKNSENIQLERLGVKREQTEQAEGMMAKSGTM